jgi:hypothetical protein
MYPFRRLSRLLGESVERKVMRFVNEAGWDRAVRVALGIVLLALGWTDTVTGTFGTVLQVVGFVPLLTGLVGWCPLYALIGFRTNRPAAV